MSEKRDQADGDEYWKGTVDSDLKSIKGEVGKTNEKVDEVLEILKNGKGADNPGLISQVRDLSRWKGKLEKVGYLVVSAIVLDIVMRVINSPTIIEALSKTP